MKGLPCLLALLLFILAADGQSRAWVLVPDHGDTGWQTFIYDPGPSGFTGTAGFVVSNVIDDSGYSELLLGHLSHGGDPANLSFQLGDYTGYSLLGDSYAEVANMVTASSGKIYTSIQGEYFSRQLSLGAGVGADIFVNARGQPGTSGSILETPVTLPPGSKFTFTWAFLAGDQAPWDDFALFYLKDTGGNIVFSAGLAQIGRPPVAVPPAHVLLGE